MKSFNENWDGIYRKAKQVEVNEENLNIGTYGFRIDRDSGKFVLYQLSYSQGSVRFPDGRKGTVIGRYATRDEAVAAAKRQAGVKEEVEMEAYGNPFTPRVVGWADPSNLNVKLSAGTKVKVPHKGKMVSGKIVRYDKGGTGQARQHGGGYIVDVGEPASILVPDHKVWKEEMTESSNLRTDLTNPKGKAVVDAKGKVIAVYRTERAARKHAETGKPVKEETELDEGLFNIINELKKYQK